MKISTSMGAWCAAISIVSCVAGCSTPKPQRELRTIKHGDETMAKPVEQLDLQGHRGARGLRPESTLPSFEAALDLGVTTLELDLHLTKDDVLVVWHDPFVSKTKCHVGQAEDLPDPDQLPPEDPSLALRNLTAEQLGRYVCDRNPDPTRFPEQQARPGELSGASWGIATLDAVLDFAATYAESDVKAEALRKNAAKVRFNIETKRVPERPELIGDGFDGTAPGTFETTLVETLRRRDLVARSIIQSFDPRSLWAVRQIDTDVTLAVLEEERRQPLSEYARRGATIWSPKHTLVDAASMAQAHAAGLTVVPWTVNELNGMKQLVELGVDGLISDRPDLFTQLED